MNSVLLVALGGAIGSVARFKLSGWILHQTISWRFPLGTLAVNVVGCLVIGVLAGFAVKEDFFPQTPEYSCSPVSLVASRPFQHLD